jgi:hypothetical protein
MLKVFVAAGLAFLTAQVWAGETMFGYLYTTDTTPAGHWEYEQSQTLRWGKVKGDYTAVDLRNEFEYGVTDKFQASVYINSSYIRTRDSYDMEMPDMPVTDKDAFNVNGTSIELIYRLLSPYTDGFGLALYAEPELSVRNKETGDDRIERALEFRIILQKNFFDDKLIVAANLMTEPEWEKDNEGVVQKELWGELTLGATYRVAPKWYAGFEFRNHMEWPDMNLGHQEHSAYFLGPSVHYGSQSFWAQLTVLPQIWGWPRDLGPDSNGNDLSSSYAHLMQHEKSEIRLKFGIPF